MSIDWNEYEIIDTAIIVGSLDEDGKNRRKPKSGCGCLGCCLPLLGFVGIVVSFILWLIL